MDRTKLQTLLDLDSSPVAISFVAAVPSGVLRIAKAEPAGCGYWRRAAAGETFYTEAADHVGCAIGAHTHAVALTPVQGEELAGLIGTMVGLEYLQMADVAGIPTMPKPFERAVYAPLDKAPVAPDVVLVRGNARQLMLLAEAAQSAGAAGVSPMLGRPTCAVLPAAVRSQKTAASFGCIGNRVYTGASENDAYFAIPGDKLDAVVARLEIVLRANAELEKFHRARLPLASSAGL